mmetsp:Transcript_10632/g.36079  ORF Transcript_10632/g.36079 Transcript_10632/m.36079 type:complete len:294 (+) Transcript_10632:231-1112(+)
MVHDGRNRGPGHGGVIMSEPRFVARQSRASPLGSPELLKREEQERSLRRRAWLRPGPHRLHPVRRALAAIRCARRRRHPQGGGSQGEGEREVAPVHGEDGVQEVVLREVRVGRDAAAVHRARGRIAVVVRVVVPGLHDEEHGAHRVHGRPGEPGGRRVVAPVPAGGAVGVHVRVRGCLAARGRPRAIGPGRVGGEAPALEHAPLRAHHRARPGRDRLQAAGHRELPDVLEQPPPLRSVHKALPARARGALLLVHLAAELHGVVLAGHLRVAHVPQALRGRGQHPPVPRGGHLE